MAIDRLTSEGVLVKCEIKDAQVKYKIAGAAATDITHVTTEAPIKPVKNSAGKPKENLAASREIVEKTPRAIQTRSAPAAGQKHAPRVKINDSTTQVNRTVLKDYIERKRKEGARELHYIQIKNDLKIISQKKSKKLYRILQDLVDAEILVRKGSIYVVVM